MSTWGYKDGKAELFDTEEAREKAGYSDSPVKKASKKKTKKKVSKKR